MRSKGVSRVWSSDRWPDRQIENGKTIRISNIISINWICSEMQSLDKILKILFFWFTAFLGKLFGAKLFEEFYLEEIWIGSEPQKSI